MLGALQDRVDRGESFSQLVEVEIDSEDDVNYAAPRFWTSFNVSIGDVDESHVASQIFLSAEAPAKEGTLDVAKDENAADFVFAVALTSVPSAPVRLELNGDVGAFEYVTVGGADARNRTVRPGDWADAATYVLTVADNDLLQGDRSHSVWLRAFSEDSRYDKILSAIWRCTVAEDDVAFVSVSGKHLTVGASADGPTFGDGYDVELSAPPNADVVVSLDVDDPKVFIAPKKLRFTTENYAPRSFKVNATLLDATDEIGRTAVITHTVSSEDRFFDGIAVEDVDVTVKFSADAVPPPKLQLARFLDGGNGLDVVFDAHTDKAGFGWDFECADLFQWTSYQFGADAVCGWVNASAIVIYFGAGANLVPFDYVNATRENALFMKGGLLRSGVPNATLTAVAQLVSGAELRSPRVAGPPRGASRRESEGATPPRDASRRESERRRRGDAT